MASYKYNADDPTLRVITIPSPNTSVTLQQVYNDYRDWEDDLPNANGDPSGFAELVGPAGGGGARPMMDAFLKEDLGTGEIAVLFVRLSNTVIEFEEVGVQCRVTGGVLFGFDDIPTTPVSLEPIRFTSNQQVVYDRAVTGLVVGQPDFIVDQGWVNDTTIPALRATVLLHKDGQFVTLPGTATLTIQLHDDTGSTVHTSGSLSPDANGMFHHVVTFTPQAGRVYTSTATITDGATSYVSVEILSVAS